MVVFYSERRNKKKKGGQLIRARNNTVWCLGGAACAGPGSGRQLVVRDNSLVKA